MRYFMASLFCLVLFSHVQADDKVPTFEEQKAQILNLVNQQKDAQKKLDEARTQQKTLQQKATDFKKSIEGCSVAETGQAIYSAGSPCRKFSPDQVIGIQKQIEATNKEITDIEPRITGMDAGVKNLTDQMQRIYDSRLAKDGQDPASLRKVDQIQNSLLGLVSGSHLVYKKFSDLKVGQAELGATLDRIQTIYDQSTLGVYLQNKIGALMNSHLFCDAVKNRCGSKEPYPIGPDKLKEIFPEASEANARTGQQMWDRTMGQTFNKAKGKATK
jgi:hypothetical protein